MALTGRLSRAELKARIAELEAQVAALEEKNAALQTTNEGLVAKIAEYKNEIQALQATIAQKDARIATLEAEVVALNKRINDLLNPTEPTPSGMLMGVTVTGGVRKNMPDLHDDVEISRVFAAGATSWANEGQHKAFPNGRWACSNSYALSEANLPKMLASIPDADKKKIIAWADGHELEHPDKNLRPADVKARVKRTAPVIRAAGLRAAWCMMGYSLRNEDWLNWVDPDDVDVLYFDKYNSANKKTPPGYTTPEDMVRNAVEASKRFGKPWGFWETGTNNFGDQAARVAWAKALRAEMARQGAECAIWFDRPSTSGSDWDATLDRPTAEAWLL